MMPWYPRPLSRALIAVAATALLTAACGSNGKVSTAGPNATTAPARTTTTSTADESAAARAWIDAGTVGLLSDPDRPKGMTATNARCMARAVVDTLTVTRLKAAGTTLAEMREPNTPLPKRLAAMTPTSVKIALGGALQRCGMGPLLANAFVQGFTESLHGAYRPDVASTKCVGTWVQSPARRELLASLVVHGDVPSADYQQLADVVLDCFDFAAMIAPTLHLALDSGERSCIDTAARNDPELRTALAGAMHGGGKSTDVFEGFGVRIVHCLTPQHLEQLRTQSSGTKPDPRRPPRG